MQSRMRAALSDTSPRSPSLNQRWAAQDENAFQTDRLKLNIGDYNLQALTMFRTFLHEV